MVGNGRLVRMLLLAAAGGLFGAGCGSGNGVANNGASSGKGTISGMVVQAPVSGATVTAYKLDAAMTRGAVLGTATTADGDGGRDSDGRVRHLRRRRQLPVQQPDLGNDLSDLTSRCRGCAV